MSTTAAPSLEAVETHAGGEFFCRALEGRGFGSIYQPSVLVAGCGAGHEAVFIQQRFDARVEAIDIEVQPNEKYVNWPGMNFQPASVEDMPFSDACFDAVFYHHVIEHVGDPAQSLQEIARVLGPDGWLFLGTPNRHRLISAVGSHEQTDWESTAANKLKENVQDWWARLRGRFRNEYGAHAGFATGELDRMLAQRFADRHWLTKDYLRFKYREHPIRPAIGLATTAPLRWCLAPSIYVICRKG